MPTNFSMINKTKGKLPSLPFVKIKNDILGKEYSLSVAFIDEKTSKQLNTLYRKKNKPANILSFPLRKNEGEILLCPKVIKSEAKNFDKTFDQFLKFLVIHGMLHLKGLKHSARMDKEQNFYFAKYDKKHFSGNRHRIPDDKSSRGRIYNGRKKS